MNGSDHYFEAERLLDNAREDQHVRPDDRANVLAAAQVHATLAVAAATAYPAIKDWMDGDADEDGRDWAEATS